MDYHTSSSSYDNTYAVLELCLKDILSLIKPLDNDRVKRLNIINDLSSLIRSVDSLKGAVVKPFGSFVSNLYSRWGDMDISVELSSPSSSTSTGRKRKLVLLRSIMKALIRTGGGQNFQFIPSARVPLLIFNSSHQNISCDVSIDNHLGYMKSKILLWITDIDERFRDMVLLIKEWAKANNINDPKSGTLNSYSLCLLVIFHFQTCQPAIFPPLKDIYGRNISDDTGMAFISERYIEGECAANIARFKSQSSRRRNQSSLSQLLTSFFDKFSTIGILATDYAICTYTGQWERITGNSRWMGKPHCLLIEDPFEQPGNAARAVGLSERSLISNAFADTYQKLSSHNVLGDRRSLLASLVRPNVSSQLRSSTRNYSVTSNSVIHGGIHRDGGLSRDHIHTAFCGVVTHSPLHDRFHNAPILSSHSRVSSSPINSQRQGAEDMRSQLVWMPRGANW